MRASYQVRWPMGRLLSERVCFVSSYLTIAECMTSPLLHQISPKLLCHDCNMARNAGANALGSFIRAVSAWFVCVLVCKRVRYPDPKASCLSDLILLLILFLLFCFCYDESFDPCPCPCLTQPLSIRFIREHHPLGQAVIKNRGQDTWIDRRV
jgi:hypothetical protein